VLQVPFQVQVDLKMLPEEEFDIVAEGGVVCRIQSAERVVALDRLDALPDEGTD
jgi:hypothetical protein